MEPIFEFGLEMTRWLQVTYPQLEGFFQIFTEFGIEEFYLLALPLIYWCLHKQLGKHLAYVFLLANVFNNAFKHGLRGPRPFWVESDLGLAVEHSYGVPSGHAQAAAAMYFFLAAWFRRNWVWALAILLVLLMSLSRIYLGVHYVHDAVVGILISSLIIVGYFVWQHRFADAFGRRILGFRLLVAVLLPVSLTILYIIGLSLIGEPDFSVEWAAFIPDAELEGMQGMTTAVSALLGIGVGLILESSRVRFRVEGPVWKRFLRFLVGIAGVLAIWAGLRFIFPSEPLGVALFFRFVRYTILTMWVAYWAPMLFVRIGLADADPEPGISISLRNGPKREP